MLSRLLLVVDLLLVVLAGTLGTHLYRVWTAAPTAPAGGAAARPAGPTPSAPASAPAATPAAPLAAFAVIAERNLFSQTRAEITETPKPAPSGIPPAAAGPKPRLYGVVLAGGDGARAYLEDPRTRKVFGYAVGDTVAESRVEEIKTDRVVLRRGAEVFEVLLRDPSKPRAPATPTMPTAPGRMPQVPGAVPGAPPFAGQVPGGMMGPQAVPVIPGGEPVDPAAPVQPGMPTPGFTPPFPVPGQQPFIQRPQIMPQTSPPTAGTPPAGNVPRRVPGQPTVPRAPIRPYSRPQPRGDTGS